MPVSLDIDNGYIKIIEGEQSNNKIKIKKSIIKEIDKTYVHNGYVNNKTELTLVLTDIVREYDLKNKECYIAINTTDTITKEITLPKTKSNHLEKLIKNSIKELFGDIVNLCIDYKVYEEFKKDGKNFYRILIYGVPLKIVQDYKSIITNCGLIPKVLDIKRSAISKLLDYKINNNDIKNNIKLFIDISGDNMLFNLMSGNIPLYKRDVDISEDIKREKLFLNRDDKKELLEEENSEFLEEVATTFDENINKNDDEITFLEDQDYFQEEASFVSPILLKVYEEINKIIQFSMSLNSENNIEKIYLYGDREDLDEISEYIDNNINSSTEKIYEISNVKSDQEIDISKFFIAIGNILRK